MAFARKGGRRSGARGRRVNAYSKRSKSAVRRGTRSTRPQTVRIVVQQAPAASLPPENLVDSNGLPLVPARLKRGQFT